MPRYFSGGTPGFLLHFVQRGISSSNFADRVSLVLSLTNNTSDSMRQPRPAREFAGYLLAAAYFAIVCISLWHLRGQKAEGRIDGIEATMHLLLLATIGGTTVFLYRLARRVRADVREKARLIRQLRESETTFRAMFDNAVEGMFQTTPEGRYLAANKALARMYGYKSPAHLIETLSDIGQVLCADPAQRAALFEALNAQDAVSNYELEVVRADGRPLWLRTNVRAVRDAARNLVSLEGTVEDISIRHWSEQRRALQEATARVLSEAASVAEARPKILESICDILEWKMGAVWDVDAAEGVLRCVEVWQAPDFDETKKSVRAGEILSLTARIVAGSVVSSTWRRGQPSGA